MDEDIHESVAYVTRKTGSFTAEARRTQRPGREGEVEKISISPSFPSAPPQRSPRLGGEVLVPVDFLRIQPNLQINIRNISQYFFDVIRAIDASDAIRAISARPVKLPLLLMSRSIRIPRNRPSTS